MSPAGLTLRLVLAFLCPPLGVIGLNGVGCGTLLLLFLLTLLFYLPGQIAAIVMIIQEYSRSNN